MCLFPKSRDSTGVDKLGEQEIKLDSLRTTQRRGCFDSAAERRLLPKVIRFMRPSLGSRRPEKEQGKKKNGTLSVWRNCVAPAAVCRSR